MRHLAVLLTTLIIIISMFSACTKSEQTLTAAELLDLGEKYLLEMDYEQALVQFLKVIEVEPMNPRGYTGAAEAYVGLDKQDDAITVLLNAQKILPNNKDIELMLSILQSVEETNHELSEQEQIDDTIKVTLTDNIKNVFSLLSDAFQADDRETVWLLLQDDELVSFITNVGDSVKYKDIQVYQNIWANDYKLNANYAQLNDNGDGTFIISYWTSYDEEWCARNHNWHNADVNNFMLTGNYYLYSVDNYFDESSTFERSGQIVNGLLDGEAPFNNNGGTGIQTFSRGVDINNPEGYPQPLGGSMQESFSLFLAMETYE